MNSMRIYQRGVASIPIVLAFGILIIAIGVGITTLSYLETVASQGSYDSERALTYADAGARDALERIARNKLYACATNSCYTVEVVPGGCAAGSGCAYVSVSTNSGSSTDPKIITSQGISGLSTRTIQVSVQLDSNSDGQISSTQWSEVTQ